MDEIKRYVQALLPEAQAFLMRLIEIPSCSSQEENLARFVADEFRHLGLEVDLQPLDDSVLASELYASVVEGLSYSGRHNVLVKLKGQAAGKGGLLLNTHLDTVPPAKGGVAGFAARVKDDTVFGRGACDAKGQIATAYLTLSTLVKRKLIPPRDLMLHLVVEEEIGGNGALAVTQRKWDFEKAVVMEPTDLRILTAARGVVWFRFVFSGTAGHSGQARGTDSALKLATRAMGLLEDYHRGLLLQSAHTPPFEEFENPMPLTFGILKSGEWPATVPDAARLEGVMGFLPNKTGKEVTGEIRQLLQASPLAGKYKLDFTVLRDPSVTDRGSPFIEQMSSACRQAGCGVALSALTACCDAWFYTQQGIPTVIFGPGSLLQAHSASESIPMPQVALAAETLVRLALEA